MKHALKRVAAFVVTMLLVSLFTFFAFSLIAGDPVEMLLGTNATPAREAALRAELGLDQPLILRYFNWLGGFFTGDLGISYRYRQPVWELVAPKIGVTLLLTAMSFVLIVLFAFPLGLLSAKSPSGPAQAARTVIGQLGMAVPPFALGIALSWVFGVVLRFFTPGAFPDLTDNFAAALKYLFFAAVCIAVPRIAMTARLLRSLAQSELKKDYVRASRGRGASLSQALALHALKNTLVPTIAFLGQTMAEIVGAGIIVEQVFAVPGLGRLLVSSVANRDYPVVMAAVVLLAFGVTAVGMLADLLSQTVDPRLRLGGHAS